MKAQLRILFVEDDAGELESLTHRLRPLQGRWAMTFAQGPGAALSLLDGAPFDGVVSALHMRDMSGVELLTHVRAIQPRAMRLVLSDPLACGSAWGTATLGVSHQVIAKPCDAHALDAAINRVLALHGVLDNELVRSAIASIESLPTTPVLYERLSRVLEDPAASMASIGTLIESDPAITARLLQLVSSAFFARGRPVTSVQDAVKILGIETVRSLVLSTELFCLLDRGRTASSFALSDLNAHALHTARITLRLLDGTAKSAARLAFSAALLHDIGIMIMAMALPDAYERAVAHATNERISLHRAELATLGFTHAEIGAYLLAIWGLPEDLVEVVAHHHVPSRARAPCQPLVGALHVADYLAHASERGRTGAFIPELDPSYSSAIPVEGDLERWRALTNNR